MSRLYANIKALCKYKGVQISDIESPLPAGTISRYERRGTIGNLPIDLVYRASTMLGVSIEELYEKDMAGEIKKESFRHELHGIFRKNELSEEDIKELHQQVDIILEYAKKKKDEPQTDCAWK